jgi:hypothetical protein
MARLQFADGGDSVYKQRATVNIMIKKPQIAKNGQSSAVRFGRE